MEGEFKVTFVLPKDEVQAMIEMGVFGAQLELKEIDQITEALVTGQNEVVLLHKTSDDAKKEKLNQAIEGF